MAYGLLTYLLANSAWFTRLCKACSNVWLNNAIVAYSDACLSLFTQVCYILSVRLYLILWLAC